jgi:hypothetical protein
MAHRAHCTPANRLCHDRSFYSDPPIKEFTERKFQTLLPQWIGATDSLLHQTESESDIDPLGTGKMIHSKTTVTFYDYNADIQIEAPRL